MNMILRPGAVLASDWEVGRMKIFDDHPQMVGQIIRRDLHDNIGLLLVVGLPAIGHIGIP